MSVVAAAALVSSGLAACSGSSSGGDGKVVTAAEVGAALSRHADAVLHHDRPAYLAGLDGAAAAVAFRSAQTAAYANLVRIPFGRFAYALGPAVTDTEAQAAARQKFGPSARVLRLSLSYTLSGIDVRPTSHDLWWTFVRRDGHVVAAADDALADAGGASWQGPWDFGPVAVVRGRSSLVLGPAALATQLPAIAAQADAAIPAVTAVWGTSWTRRVAVEVAGSDAALTADLDATTPVTRGSGTSALAVSDGTDTLSGMPIGQRLVVDPLEYDRLSDVGRRITVTHEVTHIASAAVTGAGTPRWLVEGFAEYVGNLHSGQSVPTTARELRAQVRSGHLPAVLPTSSDLGGSDAAAGYEASWLACRLIASTVGAQGLVRLYRSVGTSELPTDDAVTAAFRAILHTTTAAFTARWRAYLRAQLR